MRGRGRTGWGGCRGAGKEWKHEKVRQRQTTEAGCDLAFLFLSCRGASLFVCSVVQRTKSETKSIAFERLGPRPTDGAPRLPRRCKRGRRPLLSTTPVRIVPQADERRHSTHTLNCSLPSSGGPWPRPRRADRLGWTEKVPEEGRHSISLLHHRIHPRIPPTHTHTRTGALSAVATSSSTARARLRSPCSCRQYHGGVALRSCFSFPSRHWPSSARACMHSTWYVQER